MDYRLAKQIYGQPWCMDEFSFMQYMSLLDSIRLGSYNHVGEQLNSTSKKWTSEIIAENPLLTEGVAVINFNGAILLDSSLSTKGVKEIGSEMQEMDKDSNIKSFLIVANSGGGSSMAVEYMLQVMSGINKPIFGFIPYGGMACSAMAMILCGCQKIYAEHEMSLVGSFGSVLQLKGAPDKSVDSNGNKNLTIYATKSKKKNEWVDEAINNDNVNIIISEFIDPMNERVLSLVEQKRPQLKNINYDEGKTYFAKDVVGSVIDGIKSIDLVLQELNGEIKKEQTSKQIISKMTLQELKSQHPEIFNQAVEVERERVMSWMAHIGTDAKTVIDGIKSGVDLKASTREELLVKATQKNGLKDLTSDSPKDIKEEPKDGADIDEKDDEKDELESFYSEISNSLR